MEIKRPDENKLAPSRLLKHFFVFFMMSIARCKLMHPQWIIVGPVDMFCSFAPGLKKKKHYSSFQLYIYIHKANWKSKTF